MVDELLAVDIGDAGSVNRIVGAKSIVEVLDVVCVPCCRWNSLIEVTKDAHRQTCLGIPCEDWP